MLRLTLFVDIQPRQASYSVDELSPPSAGAFKAGQSLNHVGHVFAMTCGTPCQASLAAPFKYTASPERSLTVRQWVLSSRSSSRPMTNNPSQPRLMLTSPCLDSSLMSRWTLRVSPGVYRLTMAASGFMSGKRLCTNVSISFGNGGGASDGYSFVVQLY